MANEGLAAQVKMTNLGMKSDNVGISLFGDVKNASTFTSAAPALRSFTINTPVIGNVANISAQNYARIGINISGHIIVLVSRFKS